MALYSITSEKDTVELRFNVFFRFLFSLLLTRDFTFVCWTLRFVPFFSSTTSQRQMLGEGLAMVQLFFLDFSFQSCILNFVCLCIKKIENPFTELIFWKLLLVLRSSWLTQSVLGSFWMSLLVLRYSGPTEPVLSSSWTPLPVFSISWMSLPVPDWPNLLSDPSECL